MSIWGKPIWIAKKSRQYTAYTVPQTGVTYTDGLAGLDATTLHAVARAIANNALITSSTGECWVSGVDRHISVGNDITLAIDGTGYAFRLMGFNHFSLSNAAVYGTTVASGCAGMLFQFYDTAPSILNMTMRDDNVQTYWTNCDVKAYLDNTLPALFAPSVQGVMKSVKVYAKGSGTGQRYDYTLFIPAIFEVLTSAGTGAMSDTNEQDNVTRYKYYADGGLYPRPSTAATSYCWTRSKANNETDGGITYYRMKSVNRTSSAMSGNARRVYNQASWVLPCLCI